MLFVIFLKSSARTAHIHFVSRVKTYVNGKSVHSVLITPSSTGVDPATSVKYYENDPRRATIATTIGAKFFRGILDGENRAKLQGFALINTDTSLTPIEISFHVDLNMVSLPSSKPSMIPSKSVPPSARPSLSPSSFQNRLQPHVEIWGEFVILSIYNYRFFQIQSIQSQHPFHSCGIQGVSAAYLIGHAILRS